VILFNNIIQVGASADLDGTLPPVIELVAHAHAAQSGMGGLKAVQGNYSRLPVALESFTEKGLGPGDVTPSTGVGFDGFALFYQQRGRGTSIDLDEFRLMSNIPAHGEWEPKREGRPEVSGGISPSLRHIGNLLQAQDFEARLSDLDGYEPILTRGPTLRIA
jgi:hypothetical protein